MPVELHDLGRAIAAPARSAMLALLLDGASHSAGALAREAGISSSTASEHLAVLLDSGLVTVLPAGRFRRYRIADPATAAALEALGQLCDAPSGQRSLRHTRDQRRLRRARTCYDHLAGQLGVSLRSAFVDRAWLTHDGDALGTEAASGFGALGVGVTALASGRRPVVRSCLDWTERRPHVAGALGAAVATSFFDHGWVTRQAGSRGLTVTASGQTALGEVLGIDITTWDAGDVPRSPVVPSAQ